MRQALAGMLWTKQYYYFDVDMWLDEHQRTRAADGRRPQPAVVPHGQRRHHLDAGQVGVPLVRRLGSGLSHRRRWRMVDPDFAKDQLELMLRERYLHPNGQIPAYEWNFAT